MIHDSGHCSDTITTMIANFSRIFSMEGFSAIVNLLVRMKENERNTARSAEVEPPGLGSKCGKRVERVGDF